MKPLFVLLAIALPILGVTACDDAGRGAHSDSRAISTVATSGGAPTHYYLNDGDNDPSNDGDTDNNTADDDNDSPEDNTHPENNSYHDKDDGSMVAFGHAASAADKQAVTAVVKRYYAVAAAADGTKACSMIAPSLERSIPEDYGKAPGPAYLRGAKTCPAVMRLLFEHSRNQLTSSFEVTDVRVKGNEAIALLGSTRIPASAISLAREGGSWKIEGLLGGALT